MKAFRCKECGHLETSGQAGECAHPASCVVCCAGTSFHPKTGIKTLNPDNWEVLANCTPARLAELGLAPDKVAKHTPAKATNPGRTSQHVQVTANEGMSSVQSK